MTHLLVRVLLVRNRFTKELIIFNGHNGLNPLSFALLPPINPNLHLCNYSDGHPVRVGSARRRRVRRTLHLPRA